MSAYPLLSEKTAWETDMKKSIVIAILSILLSVSLIFPCIPSSAANTFKAPAAKAALLAELDTGMVLYELNENTRHPADALAKVMTLLLAVTACQSGEANPNETIVMTESAFESADPSSSTPPIMPGEELTLLDLMYIAYLGDKGEACDLLAEHLSGSSSAFVTDMNIRARELGCQNTNFTGSHGQYNPRQYTTAADQFLIFREALSQPLFAEISGTFRHEIDETNMNEPRTLTSANQMLSENSKYYYKPCTSGITSATFDGGYSFVSFAEANELSLVCVVLGAEAVVFEDDSVELQNLTEAIRLYEWGFSQFSLRTILSPSDLVGKVPVMHGAGTDFVNLRPESAITVLLDNDISEDDFEPVITYYLENGEAHYAPISAGEVLGEVLLVLKRDDYEDLEFGPVLLVASTDVELHRVQFILMRISEMLESTLAQIVIWILIILVLGYVSLVVRYNILRRNRLRKIEETKARLRDERQGTDTK